MPFYMLDKSNVDRSKVLPSFPHETGRFLAHVKFSEGAEPWEHCREPSCIGVAEYLCDYPVGDGKTCDRPLCVWHANEISTEMHYCPVHHFECMEFSERNNLLQRHLEWLRLKDFAP